jgi:hypothetical protein
VIDFLRTLQGVEIGGVIKFPDILAADWELLLTKTIEDLVDHQERALIFLWDEMPMMLDNIRRHHGEELAEHILNTLRSLRQMHPSLRMVYTGSIGLHHVITSLKRTGYPNAPTNDMFKMDVLPLSPADAQELAWQLLEGEGIPTAEPVQLDILAAAEQSLAFDDLFNGLQAQQATEDRDTARHVLRLLHDDHYLTRHADGTYQFRFSIIQRWWRLERGLGS